MVVGGGLASIDVVKVLQIENYERALKARGFQADMHELEKRHSRGVQGAWSRSGELGREGLPADLPPPRAGYAAGAAAGQRHA